MDDNYLSKSDNFDTERPCLKDNLRVVSTVYLRDRTISQLLHNKTNADELMANSMTLLAAPEPSPSALGLLSFFTKREEV